MATVSPNTKPLNTTQEAPTPRRCNSAKSRVACRNKLNGKLITLDTFPVLHSRTTSFLAAAFAGMLVASSYSASLERDARRASVAALPALASLLSALATGGAVATEAGWLAGALASGFPPPERSLASSCNCRSVFRRPPRCARCERLQKKAAAAMSAMLPTAPPNARPVKLPAPPSPLAAGDAVVLGLSVGDAVGLAVGKEGVGGVVSDGVGRVAGLGVGLAVGAGDGAGEGTGVGSVVQ